MPANSSVFPLAALLLAASSVNAQTQDPVEVPKDAATRLEEVIVTGAPRAGTLKRDSDTVVNTITELEISRFPNEDVSDVLARLPGARRNETQSGEDRYVQIRGLDNAAASQSIDGVLLTDYLNGSRATSTELLSANFIKNITVTTTVTPDLDENSNSAHVAMTTISGLDNDGQRLINLKGSVGYDNRSGGDRSTRQPLRLAGTWQGALDDDHRFGLAVGAGIDRLGSRQDAISTAGYSVINGSNVPNGALTNGETYTKSQRVCAVARFDARPTDSLALFAEFFYLKHDFETDQQTSTVTVSATQAIDVTATSGQFSSASQSYGFNQGVPGLRDNIIQLGGDWQPGGVDTLSFRLGETLNRVTQTSVATNGFSIGTTALDTPLGYDISGNGLAFSPGGSSLTALANRYLLSGKVTVGAIDSEDHNYFVRLDYQHNLGANDRGLGFESGAQLETLDRVNNQEGYAEILPAGQSISLAEVAGAGPVAQFNPVNWNQATFLTLLNQRGIPSPDANRLYAADPADSYGQDFTAREQIAVGYGIASYGFDHARLSAGVRVAHTHRELNEFEPDAIGNWGLAHYDQDYTHVLPSVYGFYDLTRQLKFRGAFTQTLERPALNSASRRLVTSYDVPVTRSISYSNPYLLPTRSTNFDVAAEYYYGSHDAYVSLGLFSKYLKDIPAVSSSQSIGPDGIREIVSYTSNVTEVDGKKVYGKDQGVEAVWSDPRLLLFPERFGNLGAQLSYDYIVYRVTAINGGGGVPPTDTRLVDMAPRHYFNGSLFYNRGPFAANVFLQAQSTVPSLSYNPANDKRTQYAPLLDLQVSYAVSQGFRIVVEGRNLIDQNITDYYGTTGYGPAYQIRNNGRTLWMGAQLTLF